MELSNFIWVFFNEIIKHGDNNPTKLVVLMYAYFQMIYNITTLFSKNKKQSYDRVTPLQNNYKLKGNDLLENYLYIGHVAFLQQLYNTIPLTKEDYGIKPKNIKKEIVKQISDWSKSHLICKNLELQRAGFSTHNTYGLPVDYKPSYDDNQYWIQLKVPTGKKIADNGLPEIDETDPSTYKIQNFLGKEFYLNKGFSVNPTQNIIDLSSQISKTWNTGLKEEIDQLLNIYSNLDDNKKMIAELFAGTFKNVLPPPGFFICIAMQLSQKYNQSIKKDAIMYFSLASGLFDAGVSAWYYKTIFDQGRPISLIRNNYRNKIINSWTPLSSQISDNILGSEWLPYQVLTFVTPPFPDVASGHTTFSRVAGKILDWWFNKPVLYDGFTIVKMPNCQILCPSLSGLQKEVLIGEFILSKGTSTVEPNIVPHEDIILKYKTLEELYLDAGISRVYGGIHTNQTNKVSAELADWVYYKSIKKLKDEFRFESPYS